MSNYGVTWRLKKNKCSVCGDESPFISSQLGVCKKCLVKEFEKVKERILGVHVKTRQMFKLPGKPPKSYAEGIHCRLCSNECVIGPGERGYCGLRENLNGKLREVAGSKRGLMYHYLDPHVTNCCAAWFCPAGTGLGYPRYSATKGPEYGYYNLAVFFYGCNFDCLFCQNWEHKDISKGVEVTVERFMEMARNPLITCICFFGGSPEPQLPFAIKASRQAVEGSKGKVLRICFEWNGCGNKGLVEKAAEISLESGGNIKFDLKTYNRDLSLALCGVDNKRAYENFKLIAEKFYNERPGIPLLTATTLLVPGYVDREEVEEIATFISDLNPAIPYSLLIFHPQYMMSDLSITPLKQVVECYRAAKNKLKNVNVGNLHLMGLSMRELRKMVKN